MYAGHFSFLSSELSFRAKQRIVLLDNLGQEMCPVAFSPVAATPREGISSRGRPDRRKDSIVEKAAPVCCCV